MESQNHLKSVKEAELRKQETYHAALIQKRLAESTARHSQAEEALQSEFHEKELQLRAEIDGLRRAHIKVRPREIE